ncbi:MAG: ABC transporter ATP-binding protein [Betaproteobacteria bacterium]|nr:ABC transporter ATP-binding protein [Betaproteobacteria bacterium]
MPHPHPAAVVASGVLFEYPGVRALDEVSFEVPAGSVTALVGPNGAGKTTLLRCLAGLERPMLGSIHVAGVDVLEEPRAVHRRVGFLSDFFGLYDALSVARCFAHAAAAHGVADADIDGAVQRTAQRMGLAGLLERRAAELSRGQRQRVAIGQALIHAPQVLMLDEPASGLDPEARHALARLFTQLREEGITLIVSSHILAELDEYSTHMLVMRHGRIVENRALEGAVAGLARVRLAFAQAVEALEAKLAALPGVRVLRAEADAAVLELHGGAEAQAALLRALVQAGLPLSEFALERENLHESYLRTVGAAPS